ncbi:MAG: bifunctional 2-polyprenyl-6-hydroxyphenol methylase/3-demethylubiquinol 3-O-methyltransferase UbiG [Planctomycetota bacterium]
MRNDLTIYEHHGHEWWDPRSPRFRTLQQLNRFRLSLVQEWLGARLRDRLVVDLGCGGGLLSEPLCALGARVVGLDVSLESLRSAHRRGSKNALYARADITRVPLRPAIADVVLAADVLEHLPDYRPAVAHAAELLKRGGHLYVNTLNKTWLARLVAVHLGESLLHVVPRGTHDPALFIPPGDLTAAARACGLELVAIQGEAPAVRATLRQRVVTFRKANSVALTYSALFRKA